MKRLFKVLAVAVFAAIMLAFAASADSVVTIKVVPVENGTYKLTVIAKSDTPINSAEAVISYDSTVVVPVNSQDFTDVAVSSSAQTTRLPFASTLSLAPMQWTVGESRTAFKATVYTAQAQNANREIELFDFFFRLTDGKKLARDTFRLESDMTENSVLASIYSGNDTQNGAAIFVGADTYAATDGSKNAVQFNKISISEVPQSAKILVGDVTGDGTVNILDTISLMQYLASSEIIILDDEKLKAADCVLDGTINIMDAISLMQYLANTEIGFD